MSPSTPVGCSPNGLRASPWGELRVVSDLASSPSFVVIIDVERVQVGEADTRCSGRWRGKGGEDEPG